MPDNNNTTSFKNMHSLLRLCMLVSFFILPLVACSLWGQAGQKKTLTTADYHLWGNLTNDQLSTNEKWVSYKMTYRDDIDTLFVRSIAKNKTYSFPSAKQPLFTKNNVFICFVKDALVITDLQTGQKEIITGVTDFSYSPALDFLFLQVSDQAHKKSLIVRYPLGKILREISDVTYFSLSPDTYLLVYTVESNTKNSVFLTDLKNLNTSKWLLSASDLQYADFTWHKSGKSLAFFGKSPEETIQWVYYYKIENDKLFQCNSSKINSTNQSTAISDDFYNSIVISDDLERVFLNIKFKKNTTVSTVDSKVEIWNTNDKWIYPQEQRFGKFEQKSKVVLWRPSLQTVDRVSSNALPAIMLSGDQKFAVLSNPAAYEPQFDFEGERDYYITDLSTMQTDLVVSKQSGFYLDMAPSPDGKYIAYFKNKDWWVYDIESKTNTNITIKTGSAFSGKVHTLNPDSAFGNPGWTMQDKEILLYDQYDIWAITPDGRSARRLTKGRESGIKLRIAKKANTNSYNFLYDGRLLDQYNLENEIILLGKGEDGKTGYFRWKNNIREKAIAYGDSRVDQLNYSTNHHMLFYLEQKFDLPPRLIYRDKSSFQCVFQSNPQHFQYQWGKSELVHFQNSKKQNLKGVLFYPADYKPQKRYPMIVNIYETQSQELHDYCNPTLRNEPGYNAAVFTSQGYFFFMPDIVHENGNVGPSATDCVVSATKNIIERGLVNPEKIGLIGHSFGGYESLFISNHTNLFATAIASGAITDLKSMYLSVGWNTSRPEMWRFAKEQWRLNGKNPMENPEDFNRNSPLESVVNLQTPLLMWTGKEDTNVDWKQSIEYFLALRRLGKKSILLLYPKEGHTLTDPVNQEDLSQRVLQWFGHYLKDEKNEGWIKKGMQ
ncbi:S9 family peptidase [Flavobacterium psychroterrae]|uniref:S9 family peptidase n=1 Tax=Flavobacterium psychroterrae TaxID=2133767 RepID=A0ABS5PIL6_9FLAO|nr:prolyl oligopeptidase family serine peptidase [Flavobacterium psychroterrae]MBS7234169.1 S9 family peptidase [Flavobacterium psychroterrae]